MSSFIKKKKQKIYIRIKNTFKHKIYQDKYEKGEWINGSRYELLA